jgi:hypothetical protein
MGNIAFELRKEYAGTTEVQPSADSDRTETVDKFTGATVAVPPDGESFDVKKALEEGNGTIVVDEGNVQLADTLRTIAALKEVAADADADAITGYEGLSSAALKDELDRRGLDSSGNKQERRERLEAADAALAAGDQDGADNPDPDAGSGEEA